MRTRFMAALFVLGVSFAAELPQGQVDQRVVNSAIQRIIVSGALKPGAHPGLIVVARATKCAIPLLRAPLDKNAAPLLKAHPPGPKPVPMPPANVPAPACRDGEWPPAP